MFFCYLRPALIAASLLAGFYPLGNAAEPTGRTGQDGFDRTLEMQGIEFRIVCKNGPATNSLTLKTKGLEHDEQVCQPIHGTIKDAEIADLDANGAPEVYVYAVDRGKLPIIQLYAWASNNNKSLSSIYMPPLSDNPEHAQGFRGRNELAVIENSLAQRFPVYRPDDPDDNPTSGTRQLQYKLHPGEAGWLLKVKRVDTY